MRTPEFWYAPLPDWRAHALSPLAAMYGVIARRRFTDPAAARARVPVVCIGNPTAGGAGKTPTALHVAHRLRTAGRRPVLLTRGYGARIAAPVIVDPARHRSTDVGDEALLLAAGAPTVVSPDRPAGAETAAALGDVIVMDDGFQNPSLFKDLCILVVDGAAGVGNGLCLPAGPLRLPLADQLARADALLVIGAGKPGEAVARTALATGRGVLRARLAPDPDAARRLRGQPVLAYAGLGRPAKFFASLEDAGVRIAGRAAFADHHRFSEAEAAGLAARAERLGAALVTTEKDLARLSGADGASLRRLRDISEVWPVSLEPDEESGRRLDRMLADMLDGRAG